MRDDASHNALGSPPEGAGPQRQILALLDEVWGFSKLREGQAEVISATLRGEDCLAVMPTGAGKSLCFQLPAVHLHRRELGPTLVVSPLIALMDDQVAALRARGIAAAALHSGQRAAAAGGPTWSERKQQAEEAALIYASPERLSRASVRRWLAKLGVVRAVVDEAHCISEWGHDFRPAYRDLSWLREGLGVPVLAVTATAPPRVADDITMQLGLTDALHLRTAARRANLRFSVRHCSGDKVRIDAAAEALQALNLSAGGRALVYVTTRKRTKSTCMALRKRGIAATWYHAGRTVGARAQATAAFHAGRAPVMVATTAWGMGIDRSDVRAVIHVQAPASIASWAQEAGRAGRDGEPALALLLIGASDRVTRTRLVSGDQAAMAAFDRLLDLASRPVCRQRALAEALHGAQLPDADRAECGTCDVCVDADAVRADVAAHHQRAAVRREGRVSKKKAAAKIELSAEQLGEILRFVDGLRRPLGRKVIAMALRGSKAKAVKAKRVGSNPAFGALSVLPQAAIEGGIEALLEDGRLVQKGRKYPTVWLADKRVRPVKTAEEREIARAARAAREPKGLAGALKMLRKREARRRRLKPYQVFNNRTLTAIANTKPNTHAELAQLHGVGPARMAKYADLILAVVAEHSEGQ